MTTRRVAGLAVLLGSSWFALPGAVAANGAEIGGVGDQYFLSNTFSAEADTAFRAGLNADVAYTGDWDGDGVDTVAVRRGATFYVSDRFEDRFSLSFVYGRPGDFVLVGDWDGDGVDTLAVRRGREYHVTNTLRAGDADHVIDYGREADTVLVGDFDGDGRDTFTVRRGADYHVKNSIAGGPADRVVRYGRAQDEVLVGDWDGDGADSFAVRRGNTYHIVDRIRAGQADRAVPYGRTDDTAFSGDWDGDGTDSLGVRREAVFADEREWLTGALNAYRAENGRHRLVRDLHLDQVAQEQARWMAENRTLAHNPDLRADVGPGWATRSEIIVRNTGGQYMTSQEALESLHTWWRGSEVHNENMLRKSFTHVGTGFYEKYGVPYAVHVLAG